MKNKNKDNKNLEDEKIREIIKKIIQYLNSDGGDIEFVKYEEEYVYVKLYGACASCIFQDFTIQDNIYEAIKEVVPNCKGVINIEL